MKIVKSMTPARSSCSFYCNAEVFEGDFVKRDMDVDKLGRRSELGTHALS